MRNSLIAVSALALVTGMPAVTEAQGQGRGGGNPHAEHGRQSGGQGAREQRVERGNRGNGERREARGNERRAERQAERQERRGGRDDDARGNGRPRIEDVRDRPHRGSARIADPRPERVIVERGRRERDGPRLTQRRAAIVPSGRDVVRLRWEPERAIVRGCPPGLARKYNGCMPPGQARQAAQEHAWYRSWLGTPGRADYSYDEGYLYQLGGDGRIASYVPLIGGSLWPGGAWPESYQAYPVDPYHIDYYGLDDGADYRFADGAIFGVDPTSQMIQTVVALIAGDDWSVGQAMPAGYDLYNVPYDYRGQYPDTDDAWHRYSDGYVYQVDPTTQLVEAAIQLIS